MTQRSFHSLNFQFPSNISKYLEKQINQSLILSLFLFKNLVGTLHRGLSSNLVRQPNFIPPPYKRVSPRDVTPVCNFRLISSHVFETRFISPNQISPVYHRCLRVKTFFPSYVCSLSSSFPSVLPARRYAFQR